VLLDRFTAKPSAAAVRGAASWHGSLVGVALCADFR
jgi:hypothetical protein